MSTTQAAIADKNEVEAGKRFAILSYIVPFFFLVPMIQRNNRFAQFHARQALAIVLIGVALGVLAWILPMSLLRIISPVFLLAQLALIVIGIMHAAQGESKPLPIVGEHAERVLQRLNP